MPYLLAAEADKIQDFVFRSSRLREITGASQLLQHFCEKIVEELAEGEDALVHSGGAFRILFPDDDVDHVRAFGDKLADLYRLTLDSSISVAEPQLYSGAGSAFAAVSGSAQEALATAKAHKSGALISEHMPFVAFCASCGVGLAERYDRLPGEAADRRGRYLCKICREKSRQRNNDRTTFLDDFLRQVIERLDDRWNVEDFTWAEDADEVARYDWQKRNYVAYMIADGNGMGEIFSKCKTAEQLRQLSERLPDIVQTSLAEPASKLLAQLRTRINVTDKKQQGIVPVLPLIMAGDDLFVLLSATSALDFARQFCLAYERRLGECLEELGIDGHPTMSAAVVICKSKYPYKLAHQRAETLLKATKRHAKLLAAATGLYRSALNFEVVTGNQIITHAHGENSPHTRTLRPYWVLPSTSSQNQAEALTDVQLQRQRDNGMDIAQLLDARWEIRSLARTRLASLRAVLEELPEADEDENFDEALRLDMQKYYATNILPIMQRAGSNTAQQYLYRAFQLLGCNEDEKPEPRTFPLCRLYRPTFGRAYYATGMLDLLEAWGYAQKLDEDLNDYEAEETE